MSAPFPLRRDFDAALLRRLARQSRDPDQSRRLLALAEIYGGGSRSDAFTRPKQEVHSTLTLLGSGSLKDREKRLYLAVRAEAQVTPSDGAGIEHIGAISEWEY